MRFESVVLSASWIPSDAIPGITRLPFETGFIRYDDPPPDTMHSFKKLVEDDRLRFVNELRAWIEVEDDRTVDAGYSGQGHINVSTVHLGRKGIAFAASPLPVIQQPPELGGDSVTFVQTTGGRTGLPAPRHVHGKPYVQLSAPAAWTTLTLTIDKDGSSRGSLTGASRFPRHWVYDDSMTLISKSGSIDFESWYRESFGTRTPWGDIDLPAFAVEAESALERTVSLQIMRGGKKPGKRTVPEGDTLVEQGQPGGELFLLLDGVLAVEVDGEAFAEVGPGAILGERAQLEGGRRTSTLRAVTPCRVAVASAEDLQDSVLEEISTGHRREDSTI
jgi:hypothetical protein